MQEAPFHVTSKALKHIRKWSRARPGMQACLQIAYGAEEYDEAGHLTAKFEGEHFVVGYHYASKAEQWPQFLLGGRSIATHPDTLDRLRGKTLTLRKLDLDPASSPHVFPEVLVTA